MADKFQNTSNLKSVIRKIESLIELFLLTAVYFFVWRMYYKERIAFPAENGEIILILIYASLLLVVLYMSDGFKYGHRKLSEVVISQWISIVIVNFITYLQLGLLGNNLENLLPVILLTVIDSLLMLVCSFCFSLLYHTMYVPKNMLMIYGNEKAVDLKFKMDERPDKYVITKVISYEVGYERICEELKKYDAVIINDVPAILRNDILKYCYMNDMRTYLVPKISDIIQRGGEEITLFDTPLYLVKGGGLNPAQRFMKRTMDIVLCLFALIPTLPIMAVVSIAIKLEDHGPVFYRQERITIGGKTFEILKFRSMIVDAERSGTAIPATGRDPRITKVGRLIRATRLDELPQIVNILKGDMSWVGPRPERVEHFRKYSKDIPEFVFRTKVKGGLTGYAQIYGKYNTSAYDKLRLDLMYIENYSLFLDLKLIFMTVQTCFQKESTEGFEKVDEIEKKRLAFLSNNPAPKESKRKNENLSYEGKK